MPRLAGYILGSMRPALPGYVCLPYRQCNRGAELTMRYRNVSSIRCLYLVGRRFPFQKTTHAARSFFEGNPKPHGMRSGRHAASFFIPFRSNHFPMAFLFSPGNIGLRDFGADTCGPGRSGCCASSSYRHLSRRYSEWLRALSRQIQRSVYSLLCIISFSSRPGCF